MKKISIYKTEKDTLGQKTYIKPVLPKYQYLEPAFRK
jgi:hypothetical protein